jgi:dihydrofolate synthase/folylpolyglutamate synthase
LLYKLSATKKHSHEIETTIVMNSKQPLLKIVTDIPKFGSGICLHRVSLAMTQLIPADYHEQTPKIVVTGTDGKGSTSMLVNSILMANQVETGMFTSPHFLEFNERFQLGVTKVDYDALLSAIQNVLKTTSAIEQQLNEVFGVFEILFLLALAVFHQNKAQVLIFEAGIGGRYDPVRLLKSKLTALTSIALEHTALLGDSTELIAYDKLDACYPGGKTVVGHLEPTLMAKVRAYSALKSIDIISAENVKLQFKENHLILNLPSAKALEINSLNQGAGMLYNVQTAIQVCQTYFDARICTGIPKGFADACKIGIEATRIPGRFDKIGLSPELYVDCAHTPNAYQLLFETIEKEFGSTSVVFVVGASQGRDTEHLVEGVMRLGSGIVVTQASFKGADSEALYKLINLNLTNLNLTKRQPPEKPIYWQADLKEALKQAKTMAQSMNGLVFVVGGLFLAGEAAAIEQGLETGSLYLY